MRSRLSFKFKSIKSVPIKEYYDSYKTETLQQKCTMIGLHIFIWLYVIFIVLIFICFFLLKQFSLKKINDLFVFCVFVGGVILTPLIYSFQKSDEFQRKMDNTRVRADDVINQLMEGYEVYALFSFRVCMGVFISRLYGSLIQLFLFLLLPCRLLKL